MVRLTFDASGFLALYAGGAMKHKNGTMQRGGERKAAVEAATTPARGRSRMSPAGKHILVGLARSTPQPPVHGLARRNTEQPMLAVGSRQASAHGPVSLWITLFFWQPRSLPECL